MIAPDPANMIRSKYRCFSPFASLSLDALTYGPSLKHNTLMSEASIGVLIVFFVRFSYTRVDSITCIYYTDARIRITFTCLFVLTRVSTVDFGLFRIAKYVLIVLRQSTARDTRRLNTWICVDLVPSIQSLYF